MICVLTFPPNINGLNVAEKIKGQHNLKGVTKMLLEDRTAQKFETITVATTAPVQFNASAISPESGYLNNNNCSEVFITLETANIRFRIDGGTPTPSTGHPLSLGQNLTLRNIDDIKNFRAIMQDTNATLNDLGKLSVTYRF